MCLFTKSYKSSYPEKVEWLKQGNKSLDEGKAQDRPQWTNALILYAYHESPSRPFTSITHIKVCHGLSYRMHPSSSRIVSNFAHGWQKKQQNHRDAIISKLYFIWFECTPLLFCHWVNPPQIAYLTSITSPVLQTKVCHHHWTERTKSIVNKELGIFLSNGMTSVYTLQVLGLNAMVCESHVSPKLFLHNLHSLVLLKHGCIPP